MFQSQDRHILMVKTSPIELGMHSTLVWLILGQVNYAITPSRRGQQDTRAFFKDLFSAQRQFSGIK